MKQIKILIQIDEMSGRFGFIVDRDKKSKENLKDVLELIGALESLKQRELKRLDILKNDEVEYESK